VGNGGIVEIICPLRIMQKTRKEHVDNNLSIEYNLINKKAGTKSTGSPELLLGFDDRFQLIGK